ncbi:DNA-3-methyladenine glycosylase [Rothia kristinae]|nr:DNA-3-methyladenine glycosylase [Rothia kristinae]
MIDFSQPADVVAPQLLGAVIRRGPVALRLTEVEAYLGTADPASHAHKGPSPRCRTMFGPPAHLYVYASYGIHRAGNLVCSPEGTAGGVLMRAGEVVDGHDVVRTRRGQKPEDAGLARGPGNVGACLGLSLEDDGAALSLAPDAHSPEFALRAPTHPVDWVRGRRIGITKNAEAPLRFWIPGDPTVTSPRTRRTAVS